MNDVKSLIIDFLSERGLSLSDKKTQIPHISEDFDFLGFNIWKYKRTLLIKPSKKSQKKLTEETIESDFEQQLCFTMPFDRAD